jgi:hypothetical protein
MGLVAHMGDVRYMHKVLVWKHEGKRHLGIPRYDWEKNIKMYYKLGGSVWTDLSGLG